MTDKALQLKFDFFRKKTTKGDFLLNIYGLVICATCLIVSTSKLPMPISPERATAQAFSSRLSQAMISTGSGDYATLEAASGIPAEDIQAVLASPDDKVKAFQNRFKAPNRPLQLEQPRREK